MSIIRKLSFNRMEIEIIVMVAPLRKINVSEYTVS
jgi:hypothetical protein